MASFLLSFLFVGLPCLCVVLFAAGQMRKAVSVLWAMFGPFSLPFLPFLALALAGIGIWKAGRIAYVATASLFAVLACDAAGGIWELWLAVCDLSRDTRVSAHKGARAVKALLRKADKNVLPWIALGVLAVLFAPVALTLLAIFYGVRIGPAFVRQYWADNGPMPAPVPAPVPALANALTGFDPHEGLNDGTRLLSMPRDGNFRLDVEPARVEIAPAPKGRPVAVPSEANWAVTSAPQGTYDVASLTLADESPLLYAVDIAPWNMDVTPALETACVQLPEPDAFSVGVNNVLALSALGYYAAQAVSEPTDAEPGRIVKASKAPRKPRANKAPKAETVAVALPAQDGPSEEPSVKPKKPRKKAEPAPKAVRRSKLPKAAE